MSWGDNFPGFSPSLLQATVHSAGGAGVFVTLASGVPDHVYGPCPAGAWVSPAAGDACLVARDDQGGYWIVSW